MEHIVEQRSEEWFALRREVSLTASVFGDAIGVGRGKPFHYLLSLLPSEEEEEDAVPESNAFMEHGVKWEPAIHKAYNKLTGYTTRESGFWVPREGDEMRGVIGASPDAIVTGKDGHQGELLGLAEFKAPVYSMYGAANTVQGIPRKYLAQVMGQMAVCGAQWCDFMAVCIRTKEILLKRVWFSPLYWSHVASDLKLFSDVLKEARARQSRGEAPLDFEAGQRLCSIAAPRELLPGEQEVGVEELLQADGRGNFRGPSGLWMSFEELLEIQAQAPTSQTQTAVGHTDPTTQEHVQRQPGSVAPWQVQMCAQPVG